MSGDTIWDTETKVLQCLVDLPFAVDLISNSPTDVGVNPLEQILDRPAELLLLVLIVGIECLDVELQRTVVTRMSSKNSSLNGSKAAFFSGWGAPFSIDLIDVTRMVARAQL